MFRLKEILIKKLSFWQAEINMLKKENELKALMSIENVHFNKPFTIGDDSTFSLEGPVNELFIGSNFYCKRGCNFLLYPNAILKVGNNVFFNNYCSINCLEKIEIGENTIFGEGVKIYDHNHHFEFKPELQIARNDFTTSPVIIGKNCWIASNVTILKGVQIGDNTIIGANCLVYKSIPSNSIVKHKEDLAVITK